eukprot:NODE_6477_length_881_cov_24.841689_g5882_i0.p1 GENE.NODE_6477_length_881_cov_24.841689_g5882_i0~~NODE_6477_length_881_cov_24.841689_g5882_i0.p1  ORF type:complete len:249 (-),score=51.07 NODE_6477_length_881_cov_24.841689_g5882_i0:108-854(-)
MTYHHPRDHDNFLVSEPERPFIPDRVTNENFKARLDKLRSGDQFVVADPTRAAVKSQDFFFGKYEGTMLTKFEKSELHALPEDNGRTVTDTQIVNFKVINQAEYKPSEKKMEENTFTNIEFSKNDIPENFEEAEEYFLSYSTGEWKDEDTPAEKNQMHREQVQKERMEYQQAVEAAQKDKTRSKKDGTDVFLPSTVNPTANPQTSVPALPSGIVLVKKKRKTQESEGNAPKQTKMESKPKPKTGLVAY